MMEDRGDSSNRPPSDRSTARALVADSVHDALANPRRRYVVYRLRRDGGRMALSELADEIAVREDGPGTDEVPRSVVERVHVSLFHVHVPKLGDAGIVDYDRDRDVVALSANAERLNPFFEGNTG